MNTSLRATDALLYNTLYSLNARVYAAAMLGAPRRTRSLPELAEVTGLHRATVVEASKEVEATTEHPYTTQTGADAGRTIHPATKLATVDRPLRWYDRHPSDPRAKRRNRIEAVAEQYDDVAPKNRSVIAELPSAILAKVPSGRGKKNAALVRLLALACVGEQIQRGAIHRDDEKLAYKLLGLGEDKRRVARAWDELLGAGVLATVKGRPDVYVMPGGTPGKPEDPSRLDESKTKRIREIATDAGWWWVETSDAGWGEIQRLLTKLTDDEASEALVSGTETGWLEDGLNDGPSLIVLLESHALAADMRRAAGGALDSASSRDLIALSILADEVGGEEAVGEVVGWLAANGGSFTEAVAACCKKHLATPQEEPWNAARRTGKALPSTTYPRKPSERGSGDREHGQASTPGQTDDEEGQATTEDDRAKRRRDFGPEWCNTFVIADVRTFDTLIRWRDAIEAKYGHGDAVEIWRQLNIERGPRGASVLRAVRERFAHIDPDARPFADGNELDVILAAYE